MSDYRRTTRSDKHDKRQKQKRLIIFFSSLAGLFLIIFSALLIFGNKGNPKETEVVSIEEEKETVEEKESKEEQDEEESKTTTENKPKDKMLELEEESKEKEVKVKEVASDNPNVIKAFTGDWEPIGTEQKGEHTTTYAEGSADRVEIKRAVAKAIKMEEEEVEEYWVGRGGEQKVIATVSDSNFENIHRVYLDWIDEEGWQVTKVEQLHSFPSS